MATNKSEKNTFLELSIQINLDGLSFCILNRTENKIVFYHQKQLNSALDPVNLLQEIETIYQKQTALETTQIDKVNLCFCNSFFTLVPRNLFVESAAASYLKFNTKILQTDVVAHDELPNSEIINVYIPFTNIINFFFDKYGEFEYSHHMSILLHKFINRKTENSITVYAHNQKNRLDLIIIEHGDLLLCNSFKIFAKEDYLYYLLFTAEQLQLNPQQFQLYLSGFITKDDEIYTLLQDYIQNIAFLPLEDDLQIDEGWTINKSEEYILLNTF
ncbi:DUF3822 family protein [Zunongwangia sp.]|uniref:DUF3822 family protein n=1 Tax=Zunongwangia sp. TaxID=1965325 RepID=UPI003AA957FF